MTQVAVKPWPAGKVTRRNVAGLVPYARNARLHELGSGSAEGRQGGGRDGRNEGRRPDRPNGAEAYPSKAGG